MRQTFLPRRTALYTRLHAGLRLATGFAIAAAFIGVVLPTTSAQAQTARFSVTGQFTPGQTTFAENEEASFILTLEGFPDDQDIATAEVELVVQQITTGFSTPQGDTFEGTFFDVVVEGDNSRAVTLSVGGGSNNRMKAIVAFDPDDSTAGVGQPAVITWTIRPKDIATTQTFRIRRTNNGRVVLKDSGGGTVSRLAPAFVENFTITPVIAEDAVFVTRTYQNGDTIPNIKTETPTNTSEAGVDWTSGFGINLLAGKTARYSDGTAYECDSASSVNCLIRIPGGRIANGGPVNATFPEESAPPPAPPPPVTETQDPRLIYTYQNLEVIPEGLFKLEEPTNASDAGVTWAEDVSLTLAHNTTATYSDGTTYECLSSGGCVITFASRQINNGGQVRISQPFDTAAQFLPDTVDAGITFNDGITGISTELTGVEPVSVGAAPPLARLIAENNATASATAGFSAMDVSFSGIPGNVTRSECVYGFGGDAEYGVDAASGDYGLVNAAGDGVIPLGDPRFADPEDYPDSQVLNDAADGVDHRFTVACGPTATQTWKLRIFDDDDDENNEPIAIFLRQVNLFVNDDELGSVRITQPDTLVITIQDDDTSSDITRITAVSTDNATRAEGESAQITLARANNIITDVAMDYSITGPGVSDGDFTVTAIDANTTALVPNADDAIVTQTNACAGITDLRCGTLTIRGLSNTVVLSGDPVGFNIAFTADSLAENTEAVTVTFYPRNDDDGNRTSIFPNFNTIADRSARISITDNDAAPPTATLSGDASVTESVGRPNITIDLSSATTATLGYRITGIEEADLTGPNAVTAGTNTTLVADSDGDVRTGTFTISGTSGSLNVDVADDNVLEGTETFTLTLYAGHPSSTRRVLAGATPVANVGSFPTNVTDSTAVTARLSWPGRTERPGVDRGSLGDGIIPIGTRTFPGGALEGASPHVVLDLRRTTGIAGNAAINADDTVTVARDMFFPITCTTLGGCGAAAAPAARRALEAQIERTIDDRGTTSGSTHRDDDLDLYGVVLRAGQSREAVGVDLLNDERFDEGDEVLILTSGTPTGFRAVALPADLPAITTETAQITILNRPSAAEGTPVTWNPAAAEATQDVTTGAGAVRTKVSELVLELAGGFTGDHQAVSVVYRYETDTGDVPEASLGSLEWWVLNLADGSRLRRLAIGDVSGSISDVITVSRALFSPIQDGTPMVRVGLFFSPTAAPGAGGDLVVNVKNVKHVDGITGTSDRVMCSDNPNDNALFVACDDQAFSVGESLVELTFDRTASEVGPETGHVTIHFADEDSETNPVYPDAATSANVPWSLGGSARRGQTTSDGDYVLSLEVHSDAARQTAVSSHTVTFTDSAITIPAAHKTHYISLVVTPNADAVNDPGETAIITIGSDAGITFAAANRVIPINRATTITIANERVATIAVNTSPTYTLDGIEGSERRTTFVFSGRDDIPALRIGISIPDEAFYFDLNYAVDTAESTADAGTNTGTGDYLLYSRNLRPTGGVRTDISGTRSGARDSRSANLGSGNRDNFFDFWLSVRDDSDPEPPETVVLDLTLQVFPCDGGHSGTSCSSGNRGAQIGQDVELQIVFDIRDNDSLVESLVIENRSDRSADSLAEGEVMEVTLLLNDTVRVGTSEAFAYTITDATNATNTDNAAGFVAADLDDPTLASGDLTISSTGSLSRFQRLRLTIADDAIPEGAETLRFMLAPNTYTGTSGTSRSIATGPGSSYADFTIAESDGGVPDGPSASISTTGPLDLVREATVPTPFTISASNLPLAVEGDSSTTLTTFTGTITAPGANTYTTANDFIIRDAVSGGNPVSFSAETGIFEYQPRGVTNEGTVEQILYIDTSGRAGTEESFVITLTGVETCPSGIGGECGGANLTPAVTITGSPLTVNLAAPGALEIAPATGTIVETDPASPAEFTISGAAIADTNTVALSLGGTATFGACNVALVGGLCSGTVTPDTADYFLAVNTPHEISSDGTSITARADVAADAGITVSVIPRPDTTADPNETVILTLIDAGTDPAISATAEDITATVTIVDPGLVRLLSTSNALIFAVGGVKAYAVEVADVGVADGAANANDQPVRNRAGEDEIDVVIDLDFPDNNPGFDQDGTDDNLFTGNNYNVELHEEISDNHRVSFLSGTNTIRIIVPQTALRRSGASGGALAGGEQFNFQVTAKATAPRFDIDMTAYTIEVGNINERRDTLNRTGEQQSLTFVAAPPVVLTNTLADNTEIAGTQGIIPAEADVVTTPGSVNNTLTYTLTNDTGLGDISQPVVSYTLRIAPADGGAAISNEIDFITGANDADVTIVGTPFTAASGAGNENVREITIHRTAPAIEVDAGNDVNLVVPLRAGVFTGADRRFTISLHNVRVVSSDVRLSNAPPPAAQSLEVFVEASDLPTATLTVTGPRSVEDGGDATLGGLDTTTFEVSLENITPAAADTAMIVAVAFDGTAASNAFSRGADTNSNYLGVSTVNEVLYLMLDDDAFTDNEETIPVEFYLVPANAAVDETIIPRIVSANFYTESDDSGSNLLRAQNLALAITASSLPAANAATSVATANIINGPAADRTFTVVAAGAAPLVSLLPVGGAQRIASGNGSFADITVSLANLPATIGTATVGSVRLTLTAESTSFATTVSDGGKTILFGSRGAIRLTLPTEIEGLVFIPNSLDDVQVSVPAGTTEFAIRARAPAGGDGDTMEITEVAYYDDASTPAEIPDAPPPHFALFGSGIEIVPAAVVADLSADGPTRIGTGGGALGMTEFTLTLANLQNGNVAKVPVTFGDIGTAALADSKITGTEYDVDIIETTGDGDPAAATFTALSGGEATVSLTAAAAGEATVRFRITSKTSNTRNFTVSMETGAGAFTVEPSSTVANPTRRVVVQNASLAYEIVSVATLASLRVIGAGLNPFDFDTGTLTVDEGGGTATFRISPSNLSPGITDPDTGNTVTPDHIDVTLRATGLAFNQANGKTITLGNAAATLTIASTLDHEFVNDTANSPTAILRISGVQTSTITFTGGFVDEDMDFTLAPTAVAYFDSSDDPLDGPVPFFTGGRFSVNVMPISASIAAAQTTIVVDDVGAGEVVISMANLPVSSETTSVQVDMTFGDAGTDFNFGATPGVSPRLGITGVSNADEVDYTLEYATNVLSITVPRSRLLASTGDNPEARGEEEITVNFTALTADTYNVGVSASFRDNANAVLSPAITFADDPNIISFTAVAATAELTLDDDDSSPNEEGPVSGGFDLTLTNFPARETTIDYVISAPGANGAIPVEDYTLVAVADGLDATNVDNQRISTPELNPDESGDYIGSFTLLAADFATNPAIISISVVPVDDGIVEGPETVTLTIPEIPDVDYTAPAPADLEITIADADTATATLYFGGTALSTDTSDIDAIGVTLSGGSAPVRKGVATNLKVVLSKALAVDATYALVLLDTADNPHSTLPGSIPRVTFGPSTIFIPAGERVGATVFTVAVANTLQFRIDVTESDSAPFAPIYGPEGVDVGGERGAAFRTAVTVANTSHTFGVSDARDGICENRSTIVGDAIVAAVQGSATHVFSGTDRPAATCGGANIVTDTELGQITALDLSQGNDIRTLQPGDFAGLTGLTTLDLSDNEISALPAGVFDALAAIQTLDLSGNSLTAAGLPETVFDTLTTLVTLNLGTGAANDNATLTSLPIRLLDNGAENGVLYNLESLTIPSAIRGLVRFAMNPVSLAQGTSETVTVEMVDASGDPQSLPVSLYIRIVANEGVSVSNSPSIGTVEVNANNGIIIPAGESRVVVTFTADSAAAVGDRDIAFDASSATVIIVANEGFGTTNYHGYSQSLNQAPSDIEAIRDALFGFGTPSTVTATVLAPVALAPATATAAELNNVSAAVELTLNRATADVGTADVTFTLATDGTGGVGTDYRLAITRPDGSAVDAGDSGDGSAAVGDGTDGTALSLADDATTGTFRLPADVSAATFTLTPIADTPASEGDEDITIAVTRVNYNGADAPDPATITGVSAVITITDNPTAPGVAVTASTPVGDDTEITEGSADGRGTFTIALSDAPDGVATVSYTLAVSDETDSDVPFNAIGMIRTTDLGGEVPVNTEDTTTPNASPRMFTMDVDSGAASGELSFDAIRDSDRDGESVVLTVTGVTFADIGDGTDIGASDSATIRITDATPDNTLCTRTDAVEAAILTALGMATDRCPFVANNIDLTSITSLPVTLGDALPVSGDFAGLTNLETLNLINGTFSGGTLSADIFTGLDASLTTLNLSRASGTGGSGLTGIDAAAFDSLTGLTTLNLAGNTIAAVSDDTIFTPLTAMTTLNLGGNTGLELAAGALDAVLGNLTSLSWPTTRTATFSAATNSIPQTGTMSVTVQLDGTLPVAVRIPVTVATLAAGTLTIPPAVIPAGTPSVELTATALGITDTSGSISLGAPVLQTTPASGDPADITTAVLSDLINTPSATQTLTYTEVTTPVATLSATGGPDISIRSGAETTFSLALENITATTLPSFTAVSFKLNLEGTDENLTKVNGVGLFFVQTDGYGIQNPVDFATSDVTAGDATTPASVVISIPAAEFVGGEETIDFALEFKSGASIGDTLAVSVSDVTATGSTGTIDDPTATLNYTVATPVTIAPIAASINEGSSQTITLTLTEPLPSNGVTIRYDVDMNSTAIVDDYIITPTAPSTADAFVFNDGVNTASIVVEASTDMTDETGNDETVIIEIMPGGPGAEGTGTTNNTYTIPADVISTITIVESTDICGRTDAVETAILAAISESDCMLVTNNDADLLTITELTVNGSSDLPAGGDFAGLSNLETLNVTNGTFNGGSLTAAILDGLDASLTTLNMSRASGTGGSGLTGIDAAAFDSLTGLTSLNLSGNTIAGVADATIFTPLAALATLNLDGNPTLALANGALDDVLDTLTALTWPTQLQRTASFVEEGVTVGRNGTANINVTLGGTNTLPVAVTIPITATLSTISVADAVIPAGTTSVAVTISARSAVADVGGTIMLGNPTITGSRGNVRTELIANNADTATLAVVSGPTVTLAQGPTSSFPRDGGGSATFTLSFASIPTSAGGTPTTVTDVRTRLTFTGTAANRTVTRAPAMGTLAASGGDFDFDISPADAGTNSLITFTIASTGSGAEDFTVTLTSAVLRDNGGSTITGAGATVALSGDPLMFSILAPPDGVDVTLDPALPDPPTIPEASGSVDITVSLNRAVLTDTDGVGTTNPTVSLPFTVGGTANTDDYTITFPTGGGCINTCVGRVGNTNGSGTLVFAATEQTHTIRITATSDRRNDDGETIIFTLTGPAQNGVTVGAEDAATITIGDDDVPPSSASAAIPEAQQTIDEDSGVSRISVSLNRAVLVGGTTVRVGFTIAGTASTTANGNGVGADYEIDFPGDCDTCTGRVTTNGSGTLVFGEGEVTETITITARTDEEEEDPDETILFNLTAGTANGVTVSTANAAVHTITIVDNPVDEMMEMMRVEAVATVVGTEHVGALTNLIRQRFSATTSFGSLPRAPSGVIAPSTNTNLSLSDSPQNMDDMINAMGLESTARGDRRDQYAIWARGQRSSFSGTPEVSGTTVNYDGDTTGVGFGAEWSNGRYLAGLAMNYVATEVTLEAAGSSLSDYEESMTIAAPYFALRTRGGGSWWASFGIGTGTADAKLGGQTKTADTMLTFINAGVDATITGKSFEVVTGLSGLAIQKVVDSFTFTAPAAVIPKVTIDTFQAVGEITVYRPIPVAGDVLRPYIGISTIHDLGDVVADDDHGLGIRTGVTFHKRRFDVNLEVSSEILRENRKQWTVSGGVRYSPRAGGLGFSMALDGNQETPMDSGESLSDAEKAWEVGLESGYGMPVELFHPGGVLTPFASVGQRTDQRDVGAGMRFAVGNGLSLDLETTRRMNNDSDDNTEHKAGIKGRWAF